MYNWDACPLFKLLSSCCLAILLHSSPMYIISKWLDCCWVTEQPHPSFNTSCVASFVSPFLLCVSLVAYCLMRYIISLFNIIAFWGAVSLLCCKMWVTFCMKVCVHLALKWFYRPAGAIWMKMDLWTYVKNIRKPFLKSRPPNVKHGDWDLLWAADDNKAWSMWRELFIVVLLLGFRSMKVLVPPPETATKIT